MQDAWNAPAPPAAPRNAVVILLDSLNRHMVGAYGGKEFATPNLDAFAATAVRFEKHYAMLVTRFVGKRRAAFGVGQYRRKDLVLLKELVEAGKYRPVVDRSFDLEEIVEAVRYVESGQKSGNVVLRVAR